MAPSAHSLILVLLLALPVGASTRSHAQGAPDGFARGVTGGGAVGPQSPASTGELKRLLCDRTDARGRCVDNTPRVIRLERTFDFANTEGSVTETGCIVRQCDGGTPSELARNVADFCDGRSAASVTYDKAGVAPLLVGSNKTLIGVGTAGIIRGKGLAIRGGVTNVIIRNVTIRDINPQAVWGGDALTIDGADGVWVDHNTFEGIGRQMIVTGFGAAGHVTLSSNLFDGHTKYAAYCDGHHYWLMLFLGAHDAITVARNWIRGTSGRGPHSGGMRNATIDAHFVNNYYQDVTAEGAANSLTDRSHLLMEGNFFDNVSHPVYRHGQNAGPVFAPFAAQSAAATAPCRKYLGRDCVANDQRNSGQDDGPLDDAAIAPFAVYDKVDLATPAAASKVPGTVPHDAGAGHVQ